jgi:hypothetical protein
MYCSSCGSQLPSGAKACPNCGTLTSESSSSGDYPTVPAKPYSASPSTSYGVPPPPPLSRAYDSNPYGVPLQDTYTAPPYSPSPPPPRKKPGILIAIAAIALLLLVVVGGGVFALLSYTTPSKPTSSGLTPAQVNATATATIIAGNQNPYPPGGGTLTMYDPLTTYNPAYGWDHVPGPNGNNCTFNGGTYHVIEAQTNSDPNDYLACNPEGPGGQGYDFKNFTLEVQMRILKGDAGGVFFRLSRVSNGAFYYFRIGVDGTYQLQAWANGANKPKILSKGNLQNFDPSHNNTIAVVANGNSIDLYVNLQSVGDQVVDTTSSSGTIGLASSATSQPADVAFNNVRLWIFQ